MTEQLDIFRQDVIGLTEEEAAVWQIVKEHKGKALAIKADTLAFRCRMEEVRVREIISRLVVKHGKLIGSNTGSPPGFYLITDEKELEKNVRSLRHRGIMCLVRAAALEKIAVEDMFNQARMEFRDAL